MPNNIIMASYTAAQLRGAGTPIEALTGGVSYVITLSRPVCSGSAYFTMETKKNASYNYEGQPTNALGSYALFSDIDAGTLVTSSYIASVVIPTGGGVFQFTPDATVAVSSSFLRTTGGVSASIA